MTRARKKHKLVTTEQRMDATPERIAMGESEYVNPADIDPTQGNGCARRFKAEAPLDRWYRADIITDRQYDAGCWYRTIYEFGNREPRVVASYGERSGGGGESDYGLARTRKQLEARLAWRTARDELDTMHVGLLDRFLLRSALPPHRGRRQMDAIAQVKAGLNTLADYLKL